MKHPPPYPAILNIPCPDRDKLDVKVKSDNRSTIDNLEVEVTNEKMILKFLSMQKHRYSEHLMHLASVSLYFNQVIEPFYDSWDDFIFNVDDDNLSSIRRLNVCSRMHTKMWRTILSGPKDIKKSMLDEVRACIERCINE